MSVEKFTIGPEPQSQPAPQARAGTASTPSAAPTPAAPGSGPPPSGFLQFRSTLFLPPALQNKNNLVLKSALDAHIIDTVRATLTSLPIPKERLDWIERRMISDLQTLHTQVLSCRSVEQFVKEMAQYYVVGGLKYSNSTGP